MTVKNVFWKKSKTTQIPGELIFEGESIVFTKDEGYGQNQGVRIMRKDQYNQEKAKGFLAGLFKKAANIQEDFSVVKSDIKDLYVKSQQMPKYDKKTWKPIPGEYTYPVIVTFKAGGAAYELSINSDDENYSDQVRGYFN